MINISHFRAQAGICARNYYLLFLAHYAHSDFQKDRNALLRVFAGSPAEVPAVAKSTLGYNFNSISLISNKPMSITVKRRVEAGG